MPAQPGMEPPPRGLGVFHGEGVVGVRRHGRRERLTLDERFNREIRRLHRKPRLTAGTTDQFPTGAIPPEAKP